jgi:HD-GYP domain-containing protein (c-di-GMP phosphodiesterase class II)
LSGVDIPLPGRIMALADAYDAIVSKRAYKRVCSHEEAKERIIKDSGSHFDPDVVAAFIEKNEEFARISIMYSDEFYLKPKTYLSSNRVLMSNDPKTYSVA